MVALSEGMSQRLAKLEYCLAASLVEFATSLAEVMLFLAAMPAVEGGALLYDAGVAASKSVHDAPCKTGHEILFAKNDRSSSLCYQFPRADA